MRKVLVSMIVHSILNSTIYQLSFAPAFLWDFSSSLSLSLWGTGNGFGLLESWNLVRVIDITLHPWNFCSLHTSKLIYLLHFLVCSSLVLCWTIIPTPFSHQQHHFVLKRRFTYVNWWGWKISSVDRKIGGAFHGLIKLD